MATETVLPLSFFKGREDAVAPKTGEEFDWTSAAARVREQLSDAMNARNVSFLLGSGCSSCIQDGKQVGIPTMAPMAEGFLTAKAVNGGDAILTDEEKSSIKNGLGVDVESSKYAANLERLLEVLHSLQFGLKDTNVPGLESACIALDSVISKATKHIVRSCSATSDIPLTIYQDFYRKLIYRDRALPRPWVFTSNYDILNELAMDRLSIPYCNGFLGSVERRFNPATFRYSLAEQLDISSRKWSAVDNFVYLCKLHGSVSWIEDDKGLFPIREVQSASSDDAAIVIYPAPTKQSASLSSPYTDMFREFHRQIVQDQSVLFVIGYSFSDEHINNIIFQALTVPTFRLIAISSPDQAGVLSQLRELGDPRIWIIGGTGAGNGEKAHYFKTFVESFMPQLPGEKVDAAVMQVIQKLVGSGGTEPLNGV